ncbi:amino acid adenylation domain-containing protein [Zooshikella marina]|uniref:non-ribosomal peptide synthetase n=1 Tax=Zooshikella ganghwensis TaxID=202772 RepID=UPI001BB07449|nr:non-ribosomal peptide synthetase [Zooshikella ganghwensis]MBU2705623.1 amino acid adenylation domain-containing protein [Zooshikella ganghwensis]
MSLLVSSKEQEAIAQKRKELQKMLQPGQSNLSVEQLRLWTLHQLDDSMPMLNFFAYQLKGNIDLARLQQSWAEVVSQHDVLGCHFKPFGHTALRIPCQQKDILFSVEASAGEQTANEILIEWLETAVKSHHVAGEIAQSQLAALTLRALSTDNYLLLLKVSRLAGDLTAGQLIIEKLLANYQALNTSLTQASTIKPLSKISSFTEFALYERNWLKSSAAKKALSFWQSALEDVPPLKLPTDFPRPAIKTNHCAAEVLWVESKVLVGLQAQCQSLKVDLHDILLSTVFLQLNRYTNQTKFALGIKVDRRKHEFQHVIGPVDNWLPLCAEVNTEVSFATFLNSIVAQRAAVTAQGFLPFASMVEQLQPDRDLSRTPFYQVMFLFEDLHINQQLSAKDDLQAEALSLPQQNTHTDITLTVSLTSQGLQLRADYNTDLFGAKTIQRLLGHWRQLIGYITENPQQMCHLLPLLTDAEQTTLLQVWNATEQHFLSNAALHHLIEHQAANTPNALSVLCEGEKLTYQGLNERANQLACYLCQVLAKPKGLDEARVAICLERTVEMVVAMLAVLKAGGVFVPVDPAYPEERLAHMLTDSDAQCLITEQGVWQELQSKEVLTPLLTGQSLLTVKIDQQWPVIAGGSQDNLQLKITPEHLAYLIYTSGSTGAPKAVMVTHRGVVNNLCWRKSVWPLAGGDRVLQNFSFSFDPAIWATFFPLITGACTVIAPTRVSADHLTLIDYLQRHKITLLGGVPSVLALLAEEPSFAACSQLKYLLSGGEAFPRKVFNKLNSMVPAKVFNLYGPTETTIDVTCCEHPEPSLDIVPLGKPTANVQVYILDEYFQVVPVGVVGEIFIGGAGLARGYNKRPGMTAQRFLPDPFSKKPSARIYRTGDRGRYLVDGSIEYLGRVDDQVKVNGYRIELGEVETALRMHPAVNDAVVLVRTSDSGIARLVAFVATKDTDLTTEGLQQFLAELLPSHMTPAIITLLEQLPHTQNGKVDKSSLPDTQVERSVALGECVAPRTALERVIAQDFISVLGLNEISIHDDFFALGGTSIILSQLAARLLKRYDIPVPIHRFFSTPTVAGVVEVIEFYQREGVQAVIADQHASRLMKDATLADDITPNDLPLCDFENPTTVLLTGATGYLGAFLLEQLLLRTQANIYCLVRAKSEEQAFKRIRQVMVQYLIWDEQYEHRIKPLVGDLGLPRLGLDEAQWEILADTIQAIYHNGALVNFVYPYSALRAPNVQGTQEVLRLACTKQLKAVHYVSTIDVLLSTHSTRPFIENNEPLQNPVSVPEGYTGSKWVAEKVVDIGRQRGIPITIFRPGLVISHSETGATQTNDYLLVALRGFLPMSIIPDYPRIFDTVPVDYVAKSIVHISLNKNNTNNFYHLFNPAPVSLLRFCDWVRSFGYTFDIVPFEEGREKALTVSADHPLYSLVPLIRDAEANPQKALDPLHMDELQPTRECQNTINALAGSDINCPPMSEKLAHQCLQYLVDIQFLPAPEQAVV